LNCNDVQSLLDAYMDGELDVVRSVEIEQHLQTCAVCSPIYEQHKVLQGAIRTGSLYFKAPPHLQTHIQSSLQPASNSKPIFRVVLWRPLGIVAALVALIIVSWSLVSIFSVSSQSNLLAQEVVSSHIRSLMANHLVDVVSSDQHTVKPWFDGKLDFSPPVVDLASQGYPLIGGRLDYLDNRAVAALVYRRNKHIINLFIWPSTGGSIGETRIINIQGYYTFSWNKSGMSYWAVSDLNPSEFQNFVHLIQHQT
jgi:anti-sigma factor RsiW